MINMTAMQNSRPSLIAPPTAARSLSYLQHKTLSSLTVSTNEALATEPWYLVMLHPCNMKVCRGVDVKIHVF
jgi:hypothetical protein